jgi:hypothetical protein
MDWCLGSGPEQVKKDKKIGKSERMEALKGAIFVWEEKQKAKENVGETEKLGE